MQRYVLGSGTVRDYLASSELDVKYMTTGQETIQATNGRAHIDQGNSTLATYWSGRILYCCNRLCSSPFESLGQALGYAVYAETLFALLVVACYLAVPSFRAANRMLGRVPLSQLIDVMVQVYEAQEMEKDGDKDANGRKECWTPETLNAHRRSPGG